MTHEQDPPRLADLEGVGSEWRSAVRVARSEAPSAEQLAQLADGALEGVTASAGPALGTVKLGGLSALKLVSLVVGFGTLAAGGWTWLGSPPALRGTAEQRETVTTQAAEDVHSGSRDTAGRRARQTDQVTAEPQAARSADSLAMPARDTSTPSVMQDARESTQGASPSRVRPDAKPIPAHAHTVLHVRKRSTAGGTSSETEAAPARSERHEPELDETEIGLIGAAQRALTSDAQRSLRLLDRHRALYPHGDFAEERDMLRLDALARLELRGALRDLARDFLEKYPGSMHAPRVRRLLGDGEP